MPSTAPLDSDEEEDDPLSVSQDMLMLALREWPVSQKTHGMRAQLNAANGNRTNAEGRFKAVEALAKQRLAAAATSGADSGVSEALLPYATYEQMAASSLTWAEFITAVRAPRAPLTATAHAAAYKQHGGRLQRLPEHLYGGEGFTSRFNWDEDGSGFGAKHAVFEGVPYANNLTPFEDIARSIDPSLLASSFPSSSSSSLSSLSAGAGSNEDAAAADAEHAEYLAAMQKAMAGQEGHFTGTGTGKTSTPTSTSAASPAASEGAEAAEGPTTGPKKPEYRIPSVAQTWYRLQYSHRGRARRYVAKRALQSYVWHQERIAASAAAAANLKATAGSATDAADPSGANAAVGAGGRRRRGLGIIDALSRLVFDPEPTGAGTGMATQTNAGTATTSTSAASSNSAVIIDHPAPAAGAGASATAEASIAAIVDAPNARPSASAGGSTSLLTPKPADWAAVMKLAAFGQGAQGTTTNASAGRKVGTGSRLA